jgi:hypothetical protein
MMISSTNLISLLCFGIESCFVICGLRREGAISAGSEDSHQPT